MISKIFFIVFAFALAFILSAQVVNAAKPTRTPTPTPSPTSTPTPTSSPTPTSTPTPTPTPIPTQPTQPTSGPGGSDYNWSSWKTVFHDLGPNQLDYYTYEPTGWIGAGSSPSALPVVVYLHGNSGGVPDQPNPTIYMQHMLKKGSIMIWPRYLWCGTVLVWNCETAQQRVNNAAVSINDAISWLSTNAVTPPITGSIGIIGVSLGGGVGINLADQWATQQIPEPKWMYSFIPWAPEMMSTDYPGVPSDIKINCTVGNDDTISGREGCDIIWTGTSQVSSNNKNYVWVFADTYGSPDYLTGHFQIANGLGEYFVVDKQSQGLQDCAYFGLSCGYVLGDTAEQKFMGNWSDGTPVRTPTIWTDAFSLPPCPAGSNALGC